MLTLMVSLRLVAAAVAGWPDAPVCAPVVVDCALELEAGLLEADVEVDEVDAAVDDAADVAVPVGGGGCGMSLAI